MTLIGSKILHYRILEELGAGGMGIVYLAEDEKLHRKVALKFVAKAIQDDPNARDRLIREARAASKLNHPNIVAIHAIEETPEHVFIAMEYIEGESIRSLVRRGAMTWERALELAPQILSALAMAHDHDIVHRDIKSDNIFLTSRGQVKVLDFGLARGRDASTFVTRAGSSVGTPAYMSPEQVQDGEVDSRSDLFSFGVVLYEMVAGRMPFKGEHEAAVTYSIVNETPTAVGMHNRTAPAALQSVIAKLLQKNPKDRYQSAAEVIEDLRRAGAGQRIGAGMPRSARRLLPALAALALVAVAVWFVLNREPGGTALVPDASAKRKMLVVLPFENLGPTDQEYFADGVTEEITTHLAKLSGLGVISRTSAVKYKGLQKNLREIGKELGVDYALEGSVRWDKSGGQNSVRISAQLIRINDDTHLWADNFDRVYDQIFALQSEIAAKVADELNVTLLAPERAAIAARPTENLEAYDLYMRGRAGFDNAISREDIDASLGLLEQAVGLDSTFAQAQALLTRVYANQYFNGLHTELPRLEQARHAALAATRHSANQPAGHIAMGYYHYYGSRDYERALREFGEAAKMQPNSPDVLEAIGFVQRRQGRWEEAVENIERAIALDPGTPDRIGTLIQTLVYMRRWDDAKRWIDRGQAVDPNSPVFTIYRGLTMMLAGDVENCRKLLDPIASRHSSIAALLAECDIMLRDYASVRRHLPNLKAIAGGDTANYFMTHAAAYHFAGDEARVNAYADSLKTFLEASNIVRSDDPRRLTVYATMLAMLDRKREAVRTINRAVDLLPIERDALAGADLRNTRAIIYIMVEDYEAAISELEFLLSVPSTFSPPLMRMHPGFDPLRDHPRFKRLVEEKVSS